MTDYDSAKDSYDSFNLCVSSLRERLEKSRVVIGDCTLYCEDAEFILPTLGRVDAVVSDPPYPNGEGYFLDGIDLARAVLMKPPAPIVLYFWSEIEQPQSALPLVATHIWHRTNVNGKIYEPIFHFARDGKKRRSEIKPHAAVFYGAGPGCNEYMGHPTQKPLAVMKWCIEHLPADAQTILDPFMGSGTTGVAAVKLGRRFIGIERERKYFDIACRRIEEAYKQPDFFVSAPEKKPEQMSLV